MSLGSWEVETRVEVGFEVLSVKDFCCVVLGVSIGLEYPLLKECLRLRSWEVERRVGDFSSVLPDAGLVLDVPSLDAVCFDVLGISIGLDNSYPLLRRVEEFPSVLPEAGLVLDVPSGNAFCFVVLGASIGVDKVAILHPQNDCYFQEWQKSSRYPSSGQHVSLH